MNELLLTQSVAICVLTGLLVTLWGRVRQLEEAAKHFTPDHRADTLEKRMTTLEGDREHVSTALRSLALGLASTHGKVVEVKTYADETFFRKDNAV